MASRGAHVLIVPEVLMEEFLLTIDAIESEIRKGKSLMLLEPFQDSKMNILIGSEKVLAEKDIAKIRERCPEKLNIFVRVRTTVPHYIAEEKRIEWVSYLLSLFDKSETFKNLSDEKKGFVIKYLKSVLTQSDYIVWKLSQIKSFSKKLFEHSVNTCFIAMITFHSYAIKILSGMIDAKMLENIIYSALLHDIGLLKYEAWIVEKKRIDINESKTGTFQLHPIESYKYVLSENSKHELHDEVLRGIVEHEEFYDGTGTPKGISGEDISFLGKMICICSYFELILAGEWSYKQRPYREYISRLRMEKSKFDPELMDLIDTTFKYLFQS